MKKYLILISISLIFISGIIRHDVDESEYTKLANQPEFDCVGQLLKIYDSTGYKPSSSCVAINNKYILTAAHCLYEYEVVPKDTFYVDGKQYTVDTVVGTRLLSHKEVSIKLNDKVYTSKKIIIHPSRGTSLDYDIALIELEEEITGISFPKINSKFNELKNIVIGVGFGCSGVGNVPKSECLNKKIAGQNVIDKIEGYSDSIKKLPCLLAFDFDSPKNGKKFNKMGSHRPLPLEYSTNGGDSGGPLFRYKNGEVELLGVLSSNISNVDMFLKYGFYGDISYWTRISVFHDWIMDEISKAE